MSKIIEAQDTLVDARNCIECVFMAANDLDNEQADPIQAVTNIASGKINEAIALLDEYRTDIGAGPEPAPDAKPKSPAARTKRGRK
jgi:hypothetical protein